ncbi:MAG: tRNA (guanosine(37)-N1)-methyltransferase TrmD [Thermodesulfovibrionales bacterium]|nr:tRNA (guanosine(37)-N1)-methyltransferase TrmD [Thermodesulfovibrionales bacterium]
MNIAVITLFPEIFNAYLKESILGKAVQKGMISVDVVNLRDFAKDRHRTVDDSPYGGGPGMVIKPEPVSDAIGHVKSDGVDTLTVMLSPQGRLFNQDMADAFLKETRRLLFVSGRYEGIDDRVSSLIDDEVSIGDYVLTGGELPALVIIDAVARLFPGVLGDGESLKDESFMWGILDYPHYTRPPEWGGRKVPEVLLSGNHKEIARWRRKEAIRRTLKRRPDLIEKAALTEEDYRLINEIKEEEDGYD